MFRNKIRFCVAELLAARPISKLVDHPLSAVSDCLFNIFAVNLHIGGRSSICNLRTRHAVVTGTHSSQRIPHLPVNIIIFLLPFTELYIYVCVCVYVEYRDSDEPNQLNNVNIIN